MTTTVYKVEGMTCDHCVRAVTSEVTALPGVTEVAVDLKVGALSLIHVTSDSALDEAEIRTALDEAGYELVI